MKPAVVDGQWSLTAKILIGLGLIGSLMRLVSAFFGGNPIVGIIGAIGLAVYWNLYRFRPRALVTFNLFVGLIGGGMLLVMAAIGLPHGTWALLPLLLGAALLGLVLWYFNLGSVRAEIMRRQEAKGGSGK